MPDKASEAFVIKWPPFSDGAPNKWPTETVWCKRADDSATAEGWKKKIGQVIAKVLKYKEPEKYYIRDWPPGYAVFATRRGNSIRYDHYLCGGPIKFRSPQEFQAHAIWLYFSGKPPKEVEAFSFKIPVRDGGQKSERGEKLIQERREQQQETTVKQTASILSASNPSVKSNATKKRVSFNPPSPPLEARKSTPSPLHLTVKRIPGRTYRPVPSRDMMNHMRCCYRIGELVWCVIEPPLVGDDAWAIIDQWPGLIESHRVKNYGTNTEDQRQEVWYQVKLMALTDTFVLPQSKVTPYKAFNPSPQLLELMQMLPPLDVSDLPQTLYHFRHNVKYITIQTRESDTSEPSDAFLDASGPYSLAIQTAARLSFGWGFAHPRVDDKDQIDFTEFSALWWGAELIYVGEIVTLVCNRSHLTKHKSVLGLIESQEGDQEQGIQLLIERIEVVSINGKSGQNRANLIGTLYELVPTPKGGQTPGSNISQSPPHGMAWKRLLPEDYEATVDVHYVTCRYYEDLGELAISKADIEPVVLAVLQGNAPGYFHGGPVPCIYSNKRSEMVRKANTSGKGDMQDFWGSGTKQEPVESKTFSLR
ncbi:hypothetical protein CPB86DRAFT_730547 [Serendipita vermifera]|nr:hypothetical protein CPB86DRAFT_730547 [Serendipita vermifera]